VAVAMDVEVEEKVKSAYGVSLSMKGHARKPSVPAAPPGGSSSSSAGNGYEEEEEGAGRRQRAIVPLDYTDEERLAALAPATAGGDLEVRVSACVRMRNLSFRFVLIYHSILHFCMPSPSPSISVSSFIYLSPCQTYVLCVQDGEEEDSGRGRATGAGAAATAASGASQPPAAPTAQQQATQRAIEQAKAIAASLTKLQAAKSPEGTVPYCTVGR
jgi:hypothetical protein